MTVEDNDDNNTRQRILKEANLYTKEHNCPLSFALAIIHSYLVLQQKDREALIAFKLIHSECAKGKWNPLWSIFTEEEA